MTDTQARWVSLGILALLAGVLVVIMGFVEGNRRVQEAEKPRSAAEEEQPTHRVRVWCPDRKGHIDLRLPGFAQSVVIDVAAACGAPKSPGR